MVAPSGILSFYAFMISAKAFKVKECNEAPCCKQTWHLHMVFFLIASRGGISTLAPAFSRIACLAGLAGSTSPGLLRDHFAQIMKFKSHE